MDAAFDPSYEAWDVGHLMLLPAAAGAPAAPAAVDSSYLQFNAAAMLAEEDVAADAAIPVSEASSGAGDAPQDASGGMDRDASPGPAAPLPEAEATTEATAVATAATAVAEAATLGELSSYRPSLAPPVSDEAAAGVTAAAVSCANHRAVVRSTPPEPPAPRPVPPPSLQARSSVVGAQRMPGVAETPAATQSRDETGGRVVDEEDGRRGARQADQQADATLPGSPRSDPRTPCSEGSAEADEAAAAAEAAEATRRATEEEARLRAKAQAEAATTATAEAAATATATAVEAEAEAERVRVEGEARAAAAAAAAVETERLRLEARVAESEASVQAKAEAEASRKAQAEAQAEAQAQAQAQAQVQA